MKVKFARSMFLIGVSVLSSHLSLGVYATDGDKTKKTEALTEKHVGTTVEDQGKSASDVEITTKIRRELMEKKSLSTQAKNVKIITSKGTVTLKGEIAGGEERESILEIASSVVGSGKVRDEMVLNAR